MNALSPWGAVLCVAVASCSGSDDTAAGGVNHGLEPDGGVRDSGQSSGGGTGGEDASSQTDASLGGGGAGGSRPRADGAGNGGAADVWLGSGDAGPPPLTACRDLSVEGGNRIQFDAGGDTLVIGRGTGPTVLATASWKAEATFTAHTKAVYDAAISPSGQRGASVGADGMLREWDTATGAERAAIFLEPPGDPSSTSNGTFLNPWRIVFAGESKVVVTRSGALRAYGFGQKAPLWSVLTVGDVVTSMDASPDGQSIAVATSYEVVLLSSSDGSELSRARQTLPDGSAPPLLVAGDGPLVAFSPDGKRLVWAAGTHARVLDPAASLSEVATVAVPPDARALGVGPNADWIAVSSLFDLPSRVEQIRTSDGTVLRSFPTNYSVSSIDVSADGRYIAAIAQVPFVWNTSDGSTVYTNGATNYGDNWNPAPFFSPKQPALAFENQVWGLDGTPLMQEITTNGRVMGFDPSGEVLAGVGGSASYFTVGNSTPVRTLTLATTGPSEIINTPVLAPGGALVACESPQSGHVRLWDANTGAVLHELSANARYLTALVWSPDGSVLATAGMDSPADAGQAFSIKSWRASDGSLLSTIPASVHVQTLSISPDSTELASGDDNGRIAIWSVESGALLRELAPGAPRGTATAHFDGSIAFSSSAAFIAARGSDFSGGRFDSFIAILRVKDGSEVMRFWSFADANMGMVGWSPDDRYLSAPFAGALRVFCVPPLPNP